MKKLISIIVLLLLCIAGSAAEAYLVNTKTLNMRAKPQSGAKKLGSLRQGEVLQVDTIINGWATCLNEAGETFYVSSKHLIKKEEAKAKKKAEDEKEYGIPPTWTLQQKIRKALAAIGFEVKPNPSTTPFSWVFYLCFGGAIFLLLLYLILNHFDEDVALLACTILGTLVGTVMSALEIWCVVKYDGDPAWFCSIDCGVLTIIFWLVIALVILCAQIFLLLGMNASVTGILGAKVDDFDFLGPASTCIFAGIYLVLYLFLTSLQPWVVGLFILAQIVHLVLQLIDLEDKSVKGLIIFGLYAVSYLIIAVATFLMIVMVISHLFYLASNVSFWWYVGIIVAIIFVASIIADSDHNYWYDKWDIYDKYGNYKGTIKRTY